jgi:hypothetical protein
MKSDDIHDLCVLIGGFACMLAFVAMLWASIARGDALRMEAVKAMGEIARAAQCEGCQSR